MCLAHGPAVNSGPLMLKASLDFLFASLGRPGTRLSRFEAGSVPHELSDPRQIVSLPSPSVFSSVRWAY